MGETPRREPVDERFARHLRESRVADIDQLDVGLIGHRKLANTYLLDDVSDVITPVELEVEIPSTQTVIATAQANLLADSVAEGWLGVLVAVTLNGAIVTDPAFSSPFNRPEASWGAHHPGGSTLTTKHLQNTLTVAAAIDCELGDVLGVRVSRYTVGTPAADSVSLWYGTGFLVTAG